MSARYLILLFLLMLLPCLRSYLLSRPIQSTYTEFGTLSSFLLQFNPQTTISSSCTLQVTFPQALHSTNLYILYSLSNSNNLPLVISSKSLIPIGNTYSFYPNITLPLNTWYKLELFVSNTITIVYGLVSMQIISWNTGSYLIYDSNQAL